MFHVKHRVSVEASAIQSDNIFALATAPGRAALAVVRLSGDGAAGILRAMIGVLPEPRMATLAKVRDPWSSAVIDHALVYWFPGPASFTGEDCVEFSIHGSRAILKRLYDVLLRFPSTRIANAGEFSRRALLNGKLSLIDVESLGDLISAETEQQRLLGISGLSGTFRNAVDRWRDQIMTVIIDVEAALDFGDEEDVESYDGHDVIGVCDVVHAAIGQWLASSHRGPILRNGFTILISGPPNVGKSTLLNELARRDVAIVSEEPGTTRDLLEVQLDLDGYLVHLIDSAGLRRATDGVELVGINKALALGEKADLILWLSDYRECIPPPLEFSGRPIWCIFTKCDTGNISGSVNPCSVVNICTLYISVKTGYNINELLERLGTFVADSIGERVDLVSINDRQRIALERARGVLSQVVQSISYPEVVAAKLREALFELEILIGRIGVEDLLDGIFSRFCVGK